MSSSGIPLSICSLSHLLQVALYSIFSVEHFPLQLCPPLFIGQSSLGHSSNLNGLLELIPLIIGGPGLSTTLTWVPLDPGILATIILNLFAKIESLVSCTIMVAVAPSALNQVFLFALVSCAFLL